MKRSTLTTAALAASLAFMALPAPALASYQVHGTQYGIKTVASNNTSPAFARKVERVVVARFEHGEPWPFTANVSSPVTHQTYQVRFYLGAGGTTWPVIAWTDTHSWVRVYYGN
jgi:hypothetical protein